MRPLDELLSLGLDISKYRTGSYRLACPKCAKGRKDDALGLTIEPNGGAVWSCFRCHMTGGISGRQERSNPVREKRRPPPKPQATPTVPDRSRLADAMVIFRDARAITFDSAAGAYLTARGCLVPPVGSHLRWIDRHRHPSGHIGPALVALATNAVTGEPQTLHRTWIDPTRPGQKASIDKPRLLFGGLPKAGAVVRLWPDWSVTSGLAIGEGIETCLAAAHGFTPIWSTLDAGNLAAFPVLPGIEALTIIVDHDPAGLKATEQCARRWHEAGREVRGWCPPAEGEDAADFLARAA
jgi:putative DNA primase/helicase